MSIENIDVYCPVSGKPCAVLNECEQERVRTGTEIETLTDRLATHGLGSETQSVMGDARAQVADEAGIDTPEFAAVRAKFDAARTDADEANRELTAALERSIAARENTRNIFVSIARRAVQTCTGGPQPDGKCAGDIY